MASPGRAAIITVACVVLLFGVSLALSLTGIGTIPAMFGSYVVVIAALWRVSRKGGLDVGVRRPRLRFIVASCLVGASAWYLGFALVTVVKPPSNSVLEPVLQAASLPVQLFVFSIVAAIAEELIFRGVLARGLASRWPVWAAVVVSAVAFSAFHLVPAQMLGVFPLALALGVLAIRAGSVVPSVLAHALNNIVALVLFHDAVPALSRLLSARPPLTLGAAIVVYAGGVALASARA